MKSKSSKLILMRHGESEWNKQNIFTGWVDIPLSEKGVQEALKGGELIKDIPIDVIFTSTLIRAHMTLFLSMMHHSSKKVPVFIHEKKGKQSLWSKIWEKKSSDNTIPVYYSWHLNERMYGKLQGLNKEETAKKFGAEQVKIWRRSYDIAPPGGESLKLTAKRTIPYFKDRILPFLKRGENVFVPAHGNSLRSIVMYLEDLSKEQVLSLEIPTGKPIIYNYNEGKWIKE
jgi:2,3-bisphosphoglycerate-dependent phosphoglycerate mutase